MRVESRHQGQGGGREQAGAVVFAEPSSSPFLALRFGNGEKVTGEERKNKQGVSRGWRARRSTFQQQNSPAVHRPGHHTVLI